MPYRITLTINDIPIHSSAKNGKSNYCSIRLTVFTFGKPNILELKDLLFSVAETKNYMNYPISEWWWGIGANGDITWNLEERKCTYKDAIGLGFYRADISFEDTHGCPVHTEIYSVKKRDFGRFIKFG